MTVIRSTWIKRKRTNNYLQNTTQKTKVRATRIPLKTRGELWCSSGKVSSSCSTSSTGRVTLFTNRVISHEWGNELLSVFLAQMKTNESSTSNVLFTAGISSLIIGLLAIVFVIAFAGIYRKWVAFKKN